MTHPEGDIFEPKHNRDFWQETDNLPRWRRLLKTLGSFAENHVRAIRTTLVAVSLGSVALTMGWAYHEVKSDSDQVPVLSDSNPCAEQFAEPLAIDLEDGEASQTMAQLEACQQSYRQDGGILGIEE